MDIEKHEIAFRIESETEDRALTVHLLSSAHTAISNEMLEWLWLRFPDFLEYQGKPIAENAIQCIGCIRPEDFGAIGEGARLKPKIK